LARSPDSTHAAKDQFGQAVTRTSVYDERKGAIVTLQELQGLVDFHYWARDRMLDALEPLTPEQFSRDMGNSFRSIRETAAHTYAAEWIWHQRWIGASPTALPTADLFPDVPTLRATWSALEAEIRSLLDSLGDAGIDRVFTYTLLNGTPGATPFWQMLQHVVNHGTYHRGQVTTMLRQVGASPAKGMDLITFYRERARPV
jgi:uncharacterized damage-inducible protein DinB